MVKYIIIVITLILCETSYSQSVYITDLKLEADVMLYNTCTIPDAYIYLTNKKLEGKNTAFWHLTDQQSFAEYKIIFSKYPTSNTLNVCFVTNKYQARIRNERKYKAIFRTN